MKTTYLENRFSESAENIPVSFIPEILKVTSYPDVISFAGGLPDPALFPAEALNDAARKVFSLEGSAALQYSVSEGILPLREFIAQRSSRNMGIKVETENVMITSGSQQGLDLAGKLLIDPGDPVLMERPSYLGAIQAFSAYQPLFLGSDLLEDGIDTDSFSENLYRHNVKLFYTVPDFQNPTGISYSMEKRAFVAKEIAKYDTYIVEDDPYGEIRFSGEGLPRIKTFLPDRTILLGSFSKIISPGMRLGWVIAEKSIIEKMVLAKQASDLHSNCLAQKIIFRYLMDNDLDRHIASIKHAYKERRDAMLEMITKYFPEDIKIIRPEGGMFLWITFPEKIKITSLLQEAAMKKVLFVPGKAFYIDEEKDNTMRLNFSNTDKEKIKTGIEKLGKILSKHL
jgi:2-aminoadipate transaminase